jgi:hypothetical protein
LYRADKIADGVSGNAPLGTPEDASVHTRPSARHCPSEGLEIGAVVGDQHTARSRRVLELFAVWYTPIRSIDLVHGDRIDSAASQAIRNAVTEIRVEQEAKTLAPG